VLRVLPIASVALGRKYHAGRGIAEIMGACLSQRSAGRRPPTPPSPTPSPRDRWQLTVTPFSIFVTPAGRLTPFYDILSTPGALHRARRSGLCCDTFGTLV